MSDKPVHPAAEHEAAGLPAVDAIAQLDPSAIDELRDYLAAFKKAKAAGKQPEVEYILRAIAEVFSAPEPARGLSHEEVVGLVASRPGGREAEAQDERRQREFLGAYFRMKERTGLATQRQVAEACKVSVATINAIEQGLVRPQFATVQRLAAGFNRLLPKGEHVAASDLMGC